MIKRSYEHHENIVVAGITAVIDGPSEIILEEAHRDSDISTISAQPTNTG